VALKQREGAPKLDAKGKPIVRSSWVVQFRWAHPDGRIEFIRTTSPVQTRRGAEEWERNKRLALLGGQLAPKLRPTLVKEAAETLLCSSAPDVKASTLGRYRDAFRLRIVPAFGDKPISQVSDEHVDDLKARLCATPWRNLEHL
jgi:Phage integrase, N-terminal SAM-like domain